MWVGIVVHNLIEQAMTAWHRGQEVERDRLIEEGTATMRAQVVQSKTGAYRTKPMQCVGLVEHEYAEDVTPAQWAEHRCYMEVCVRNFFELNLVHTVRSLPRWRWLAVEAFGSFSCHDATVVVRPDFAWRDTDGRVVVVDWKTGKPRHEDEDLQLGVYGLFAKRDWGLGADTMKAMVVYLGTGEVRERTVTLAELEQAEQRLGASIEAMRALSAYADDAEHVDKYFPKTNMLSDCAACNFRRPCGR